MASCPRFHRFLGMTVAGRPHAPRVGILTTGWLRTSTVAVNLGDEAQLEAVVGRLLKSSGPIDIVALQHMNDCHTRVEGVRIDADLIRYLVPGGSGLSDLHRAAQFASRLLLLLVAATWTRLGLERPAWFLRQPRRALDTIRGLTVLLVAGGGNFNDKYAGLRGVGTIWMLIVRLAKFFGVPVLSTGQQIGPVSKLIPQVVTKLALSAMDVVGVREPTSLRAANALVGSKGRVLLTGDAAWAGPCAPMQEVERVLTLSGFDHGFLVANVRFDDSGGWTEGDAVFFSRLFDDLAEATRLPVLFVSLHESRNGSSDRVAAEAVMKMMRSRVHLLDPNLQINSSLLRGVCGQAELAVGVSNHFCVFAASKGRPVFALSRNAYMAHKLQGLAEQYPDLVSTWDYIDGQSSQGLRERIVASVGPGTTGATRADATQTAGERAVFDLLWRRLSHVS